MFLRVGVTTYKKKQRLSSTAAVNGARHTSRLIGNTISVQGVNNEERITTIGRGGSDASAIMLAKFFQAERCIIYTDVEGVYTTDPNKLNNDL